MIAYPGLPEPKRFDVNGIAMAVYLSGPEDGMPVVLAHGFPEIAYSWRHQIPALAAAGYFAIVPDQRGYGGTSRPSAVEDYTIQHLTGDLVALLDALGKERAVFCGHDWGGLVTWQLPLLHPERVAGVIGLNTPFVPRGEHEPIGRFREAFGDAMYIVRFQEPGTADAMLARDVRHTFRFFMRRYDMPLEVFRGLPKEMRSFDLLGALEAPEESWSGEVILREDELDVFVRTFEETGFTGGINWYRNMTRNWRSTEGVRQHVEAPSLMISAERDYVLPPSLTDGMELWVPNLEKHVVAECGHWTQQERPQEVNRLMLNWLARHFP